MRESATTTAQPDKDRDFSKLLTASLEEFERNHGFVVGDRLPNYAGFVFGNVFNESLALKQHWKDVGAGPEHGEYTHRLQWYILIRAGAIKTVSVNQEATVFASIAPWQKGKTNLWTFIFDQLAKDPSIGGDKLDRGGLVRSDRICEFLSGIAGAIKLPILSLAAWRSMLHPVSYRPAWNEADSGYTSSGNCRLSGGRG